MMSKKKKASKIVAFKYYVDFYDAFDGWGGWGLNKERLFTDLEQARACKKELNIKLAIGNKSMGEHYGIISKELSSEIECNTHR